jgi:nickel/cobalt transporter (NicO) family protein
MDKWLGALMVAAATVGSLHSLAPDHWVPFAAVARARSWSPVRTLRLTFLCGLGHVTVSAALGVLALLLGLEAVHAVGSTLEANAALLLIGFGIAYMTWGLWRSFSSRLAHAHDHGHGAPLTAWSLFLLFCADPCVAVIPMIMAASTRGWGAVTAVVIVYEIATIATMTSLVGAAHAGVRTLRIPWVDRYGDAMAGALIVVLGAVVTVLGV